MTSSSETIVELTEEIKQEIGQHFIFGFHGPYPFTAPGSDILKLISAPYYVGNVIYMKRNVVAPPAADSSDRAQTIASDIARLQAFARAAGHEMGLTIGGDQEGGLVSAFSASGVVTQFPGAMALASISDIPPNDDDSNSRSMSVDYTHLRSSSDFTYHTARATALELRMLGVNWVFAPVGDVNSERENPVIGVRSFGDDPHRVASHVLASCHGLVSAHISPSVKHFPGHGDTRVDSHLGLPRVYKRCGQEDDQGKNSKNLEDIELVPFRRVVEEAQRISSSRDSSLFASHQDANNSESTFGPLLTVMTGHMALPLVTGELDLPASLSEEVTNGILRGRDTSREEFTSQQVKGVASRQEDRGGLGFDGVVVTDCLEMSAISKTREDIEREKKGLRPKTELIGMNFASSDSNPSNSSSSDPPADPKSDPSPSGLESNSGSEHEWSGGPGIPPASILALNAGADIVMICHTFAQQVSAVEAVWEAVRTGRIPLEALRRSTGRIRKWKAALGLEWGVYEGDRAEKDMFDQQAWETMKRSHALLSEAAYARSVVCIKKGDALPVTSSRSTKVVVFTPAMESYNLAVDDAEGVLRTKGGAIRNTAGASFLAFVNDSVRRRVEGGDGEGDGVRHVVFGPDSVSNSDSNSNGVDLEVKQDEQVIFVLRNADRSPWQLEAFERVLLSASSSQSSDGNRKPQAEPKTKVVVISSSTPYDLVGFMPSSISHAHTSSPTSIIDYTHLATSEYTAPALEAAARIIFGEAEASGKVSVRLA